MMGRCLGGVGYWIVVALLVITAAALGAFLVSTAVLPEIGRSGGVVAHPTDASTPTPSAIAPMRIAIPADSDCAGCHASGGLIGLKAIPALAHPVKGWADCTACHADDRLVKTAPGHTGIHRDQCLLCHQEPTDGAASLPRPHHVVAGTACTTCHGSKAPLPTDMAGRTNCWICHPDQSSDRLFTSPAPAASASP